MENFGFKIGVFLFGFLPNIEVVSVFNQLSHLNKIQPIFNKSRLFN